MYSEKINQQILRVQDKLEQLKKQDQELKVFGASSHEYKLNLTLSLEKVEAFEREHKVKLPEDYRAFITQIGNGGAGPYYGVMTLDYGLNQSLLYPDLAWYNELEKPFPHREWWNCIDELDDVYKRLDEAQETGDEELEEKIFDEKFDLIGGPEHNYGILNLCHFGCGVVIFLVVNGEEYGHLWIDDRMNDSGIYPFDEMEVKERIGFLDWYELWLDQKLGE